MSHVLEKKNARRTAYALLCLTNECTRLKEKESSRKLLAEETDKRRVRRHLSNYDN